MGIFDCVLDVGGDLDLLGNRLGSCILDGHLGNSGVLDLLGNRLGSCLLDHLLGGGSLDDLIGNRVCNGLLDQLDGGGTLLGRERAFGNCFGNRLLGLRSCIEVHGDGFRSFGFDRLLDELDLGSDYLDVLRHRLLDRLLDNSDLGCDLLDVLGDGLLDLSHVDRGLFACLLLFLCHLRSSPVAHARSSRSGCAQSHASPTAAGRCSPARRWPTGSEG